MEISPQNWKNTFRKKFKRKGLPAEFSENTIEFWEKCGIPDFHVKQFRNEKAKPLPDLGD